MLPIINLYMIRNAILLSPFLVIVSHAVGCPGQAGCQGLKETSLRSQTLLKEMPPYALVLLGRLDVDWAGGD